MYENNERIILKDNIVDNLEKKKKHVEVFFYDMIINIKVTCILRLLKKYEFSFYYSWFIGN